jgi:very-short-patch-repair endonuclease
VTPEEIIDCAIDTVRMFRMERWETARKLCESPIEELFLAAAFASGIDSSLAAQIYASPYREGIDLYEGDHIWPQARIAKYRLDFLCIHVSADSSRRLVAVECDGHEFHERTKKQAEHDKARDRFLTGRGIKVLRFTGSEIFRDPIICWAETQNVMWDCAG